MKPIFFALFIMSLSISSCSDITEQKISKLIFNNGELYYTDSVTEAEAKTLGNYLLQNKFYNGDPRKVQLDRKNGIIHFAVATNDSALQSPDYEEMCVKFADELQLNVFNGKTVEVDLCNEELELRKNIKGNFDKLAGVGIKNNKAIIGLWKCTNLIDDNVTPSEETLKAVEILKTNFTFTFNEDASFSSTFLNSNNISVPIDLKGNYIIGLHQIAFQNLTYNGKPSKRKLLLNFELNDNELQLTSKEAGKKDIVMMFAKTQ